MKRGIAVFISLASAASIAHAQSAGQWKLDAGWLHFAPQDSSSPMTVNALGRSSSIPGSGASVESADTFALMPSYFVTDHVAIETILGVPPRLGLDGTGSLASIGKIGTALAWSPAVIAQYHFGSVSARLRPYLGAGLAYTWFSDIKLSNPVARGQFLYSPVYGTNLEGTTTASLSKSFVPIVNAGLNYNIDDRWSVGVSMSYAWLTTTAALTTHASAGTVTSSARVRINPIISFISVGYRF